MGNRVIFSYGIILCRINKISNKTEVLIISKKTTYNFVEFLNGMFEKFSLEELQRFFDGMTFNEIKLLNDLDFDKMWELAWGIPEEDNKFYNFYLMRKEKFYKFFKNEENIHKLREILSKTTPTSNEIWELPKGRKNFSEENSLECAKREFEEETNIKPMEYIIIPGFERRYMFHEKGRDFRLKYFTAISESNRQIGFLSLKNKFQLAEIKGMRWVSISDIHCFDNRHGQLQKILSPIQDRVKKFVASQPKIICH